MYIEGICYIPSIIPSQYNVYRRYITYTFHNTFTIKIYFSQKEVTFSYYILRGLYIPAVVFAAIIVVLFHGPLTSRNIKIHIRGVIR